MRKQIGRESYGLWTVRMQSGHFPYSYRFVARFLLSNKITTKNSEIKVKRTENAQFSQVAGSTGNCKIGDWVNFEMTRQSS